MPQLCGAHLGVAGTVAQTVHQCTLPSMREPAAALLPGGGFRDLFDNSQRHRRYYSLLANVTVAY